MADLDVLIPHYNDAEGLKLSLASVRAQDWGGAIRVVVADDGSPPAALAEAERVCAESGLEIDFLRHAENRGRPFMRNALLDAIDSPWVAWLDAGDTWMWQKTSVQMAFAQSVSGTRHPKHFWVTCNYLWLAQGKKARMRWQKPTTELPREVLKGGRIGAYLWTMLGPAESFRWAGRFDDRLLRLQDLDYIMKFALTGGEVLCVPAEEPLAAYHKSYGGRDGAIQWRCHQIILDRYRPLMRTFHPKWDLRYKFKALMHAAEFAEADGDHELKRELEKEAFRIRPLRYYRIRMFKAPNKL